MQRTASSEHHTKGLVLGVLGVLLLSPDTLIIRLVDTDPWTFIAWRGVLMSIGIFVILALRYGTELLPRIRAVGWWGLIIALIFTVNNIFFQLSVQSTLVANTLVILATSPLFAALFSVLFLNERVPARTWAAITLSLLGIALVFLGDLGGGDLFGNVAALLAAIGLGVHFVLVRRTSPIDMAPAIGIAGVLTCLAGMSVSANLYLDPGQFGYILVLGLVLLPASFALLTKAPQYIPAPEVSLILLLETILGPLWVWLAINEEPPLPTVLGGTLIFVVLAVHAVLSLRASRRRAGFVSKAVYETTVRAGERP